MPIAKKSVTVRIPNELYDMCNKNYDSISNAVIAGLELLFVTNCNKDVITISELQAQIEEEEKIIKELQTQNKEPNKEILQLYEARLTELQSHNETLKKELEDNKQMHNNYMLQVQTIINQRALEAPGAKRPWWKLW
jgi:hypothetical protein